MKMYLLCTYRITDQGNLDIVIKIAYASFKEAKAEAKKRNRSPYYRYDYFVKSVDVKKEQA
jgi:hypothetical protein